MSTDDKTSEAVRPSETITVQTDEAESSRSPVLRLRLQKPKSRKKVCWTNDTVDNEHMEKKKSKCCCVYKKPHVFGESSSESEDEDCEHCSGHVDKKCPLRPPGSSQQHPEPPNPRQQHHHHHHHHHQRDPNPRSSGGPVRRRVRIVVAPNTETESSLSPMPLPGPDGPSDADQRDQNA